MDNTQDPEDTQMTLEGRTIEDWTFSKADTQYLTHGLHPYPARMIPQIARRLINRYSSPNEIVLDPFCGSGTVLVESKLLGRNVIGNDINPLGILLAKVKTTLINLKVLDEWVASFLNDIENDMYLLQENKLDIESPNFPNIRHWFKENIIKELAVIKKHIDLINDVDVHDFAKVCFSLTVRKVSNIYNVGDTFIKRLSDKALKKHKPNVLSTFKTVVIESEQRMRDFYQECESHSFNTYVKITSEDTRKLSLADETVDLIVTSPPYGEEKNTISYTRWSKLSSLWLGYQPEVIRAIEKISLGARQQTDDIPSETLRSILNEVLKIDRNLVRDASSFFIDYKRCLEQLYRVLRKNSYCCIVIGNRSLKQRRVPMDIVTAEFADAIGFKHVITHHREIPTKAIPWTVAKGETISAESIIVLQKIG